MERDALGRAVFPKGLNYLGPSPGKDLILTIDEMLQYATEQELDQVVTRTWEIAATVAQRPLETLLEVKRRFLLAAEVARARLHADEERVFRRALLGEEPEPAVDPWER